MTSAEWFTALQSFGIVSSFLIGAWTAWRVSQSTKVSNYLTLTQFHREIWSLTLDTAKYARLRRKDPNLWHAPISDDERQMMTFVLLHVTCAYELSKANNIVSIHGLEDDVKDLLTFPLFRRHWEETKKFYNADFRSFLDRNAGGFSYLRAGSIQKMKVLVASAFPEKLTPALATFDDEIVFHNESAGTISAEMVKDRGIDIIVCFGFGHILSPEVIGSCRCINLHGGFLPWNRGPNPNLWSWIEGTPKGVTIHEIDRGADTGPILAQKQVALTDEMTLQETFDTLVAELAEIFAENWKYIRNGTLEARPQEGEGTSHRLADQQPFSDILQDGLDRRMKDNLALIRARLSES